MSKKITPVDKYMLRNEIIQIPGVWVCGKGICIPIDELNKAIDDLGPVSKDDLVNYILREARREKDVDDSIIGDLNKLLQYDEVREYIGMKPLGNEEFLEVTDDV